MELVTTFENLSKRVLEKYNENISITMGILVADYRQSDAKEYILNYFVIRQIKRGSIRQVKTDILKCLAVA